MGASVLFVPATVMGLVRPLQGAQGSVGLSTSLCMLLFFANQRQTFSLFFFDNNWSVQPITWWVSNFLKGISQRTYKIIQRIQIKVSQSYSYHVYSSLKEENSVYVLFFLRLIRELAWVVSKPAIRRPPMSPQHPIENTNNSASSIRWPPGRYYLLLWFLYFNFTVHCTLRSRPNDLWNPPLTRPESIWVHLFCSISKVKLWWSTNAQLSKY